MDTIIGRIKKKDPIEVKKNGFKVMNLIIEDLVNQGNALKMQAVQGMAITMDTLKEGEQLTITYIVKGKLFTNREGKEDCFVNVQIQNFIKMGGTHDPQTLSLPYNDLARETEIYDDDLPF